MSNTKNFHNLSFDAGTLDKLDIYRQYLRAWIPVFLNSPFYDNIQIFDFFAGPGFDGENNSGSPTIAVEELQQALLNFVKLNSKKISLFLNEKDPERFHCLSDNVKIYKKIIPQVNIEIANDDFAKLFPNTINLIKKQRTASLIFIDPFGISPVDKQTFQTLTTLPHTDFIFFISSAIINRMKTHPSIIKHTPPFTKEELANMTGNTVHRIVTEAYTRWLPASIKDRYFIGQFSIKKMSNVYGLIFGSAHPAGINKFASIIESNGGDANFNIDNDFTSAEPSLFASFNTPTRIQLFEEKLKNKILSGELKTNIDIFIYASKQVIIPKYAKNLLRKLIKDKLLPQQAVPPVSYEAWQKNNVIEIKR